MKKTIKRTISLALFILLLANLFLYTRTMVLSDEMVHLETNMKKLRLENVEMEKQLSSFNSLNNLNLVAESLGFTQKANPTYFENLRYAQASFHE